MLSGKLQRIICAVTDIGIDKLFIFTVGGKGWIHAVPFLPVIGNRLFHPSFSTYVNIDPGMLDVTCISDLKLTGNIPASQHCRHQGSIIKTDSLSGREGFVYVRKISCLNGGCFVLVLGDMLGYILENGVNAFLFRGILCQKRKSQLAGF